MKQRKDSIEQFTKGGRQELAQKEAEELKIIEAYVPAGASRGDIEKVARAKMAELGITDKAGIGKLMGAVIKEFALAGQAGRADGGDVKAVVEALLAS